MDQKWRDAFRILGIVNNEDGQSALDERTVKEAYRRKLAGTNPEDDPEGFKRLRRAYEDACRFLREQEDPEEEEQDTTPSGLWVKRAGEIYGNIRSRQDESLWKDLFDDDLFLSLEEEENCRQKLLQFLMNHYKLPTRIWKLLDRKLSIVSDAKALREKFPPNFMRYCLDRCERGEDVEFSQFEGPEEGDYDAFLLCYDRCWQALHEKNLKEALEQLESADTLGIRHPVMEVCRACLEVEQGRWEEAAAMMEKLLREHPDDGMVCYNAAEMFWAQGEEKKDDRLRERAVELYRKLKQENDSHYMANMRLTEWLYSQKEYKEAKKCAEKVLANGCSDDFMELLSKININIEKELEAKPPTFDVCLELCWCYLQDGKFARGIRLAQSIQESLPQDRDAEFKGLMAKLYVEQGDYEDAVEMTRKWEAALEEKLAEGSSDEEKDRDRLRQVHLIRMQCFHSLGYKEEKYFARAVEEGESVLTGDMKDFNILMELALLCTEMGEYEKSLEISQKLVDEYQIFAAYAYSMEAYRKQLNAGGVVRTATQCIRYFPNFAKAYEYLAKVYLDLQCKEDLEAVLGDAAKNGVKSPILDAYAFQRNHPAMETGQLNSALKEFRRKYLRAVEEGDMEAYKEGLPILTEYLYHYPDDFMLVERGIFHRAARRYQEAREDFEKALYINPSNPYAFNGLSFVYKYLGDYERALVFLKKAILYMDEEMSPVIYTDMGNLYSLLGCYQKALEAYRQYEKLAGENKNIWFGDNLAECLSRVGEYEEASNVYQRYHRGDVHTRYQRLMDMYIEAGNESQVRRLAALWGEELGMDPVNGTLRAVKRFLSRTQMSEKEKNARMEYFCCMGWVELVFGDKTAALKAFDNMLKEGIQEEFMEGKIADAVFACILCGDEKTGRKYALRLKEWLNREKASAEHRYYSREKGHLHLEFLAAYYAEGEEKLEEILARDEKSAICHFCTCPLCKEMEGMRILYLLRTGRREEARERLLGNLKVQPWDEFMLAIKHIMFGGQE